MEIHSTKMSVFKLSVFILTLVIHLVLGDDDFSSWSWPSMNFDSKEESNNAAFNSYYRHYPRSSANGNPYSNYHINWQHQSPQQRQGFKQQQQQQSNPYSQLSNTYRHNVFSNYENIHGYDSREHGVGEAQNVWHNFLHNFAGNAGQDSSEDRDGGWLKGLMGNGNVQHKDSSEEAGERTSDLTGNYRIIGLDESKEVSPGNKIEGNTFSFNNDIFGTGDDDYTGENIFGRDKEYPGWLWNRDNLPDDFWWDLPFWMCWPICTKGQGNWTGPSSPATVKTSPKPTSSFNPSTRPTTLKTQPTTRRTTTLWTQPTTMKIVPQTSTPKASPISTNATPRRTRTTVSPYASSSREPSATTVTATTKRNIVTQRTDEMSRTTTIKKSTPTATTRRNEATTMITKPPLPTSSTSRSTAAVTRQASTSQSTRLSTATVTTPKPVIPDICEGSKIIDKIGYKAHWSDCSKFIQCTFKEDGSTTVYIKSCANDTLWDQKSLKCSPANLVDCPYDRCNIPGFERYPSSTNCRGYWICLSGKSHGKCCPPRHSYHVTKGCVPNTQCLSNCEGDVVQDVCNKRAIANQPLVFEQYTEGQGWTLMTCPQGTAYSETACMCTNQNTDSSQELECQPEIFIPFSGDIKDESGNNNFLQVDGVKVVDNTGYFDGKSLIRVPRFANLNFGDTVFIKLRYKEDGSRASSGGQPQALIANGDCNSPSSLYLVTDQGRLDVGLRTDDGKSANVSVHSDSSGWKEAALVVDKKTLLGALNGVSHQTLFTGSIDASKCALQIGRGTEFAHFHGYMDAITVYICKPKVF